MPAKYIIADEIDDSRTADVLASGALETASVYTYSFINSGTASGQITTVPAFLHSVSVTNTAAAGSVLLLGDTTVASSISTQSSSSAVARLDLGARQTYVFDALFNSAIAYRLSGIDCNGITVTYQLV